MGSIISKCVKTAANQDGRYCGRAAQFIHNQRFAIGKESATPLEPPFTAVEAENAERLMEDEPTWQVSVLVMYVTHIDDTKSSTHSAAVRAVHNALSALPRGGYATQALMLHGVMIESAEDVTDSKKQSHGDAFTLLIACSG